MSVFLERQKVRRQKAWRKVIDRLERVLLSVAVVMGGLILLYSIYLLIFFGPYLSVKEVVIEGAGRHVSAEELAQLTGVEVGDNLFWLDMGVIHERLSGSPWVKAVTVRRRLPHTLWVYVEEYEPVAIVYSDGFFYVDGEGVVFKELGPSDEKRYPVFTGIIDVGSEHADGMLPEISEGDGLRMRQAIELVRRFSRSRLAMDSAVAEVHFSSMEGFSLITDGEPIQILFGHDALGERVGRLDKLSAAIHARVGRIKYILANDPRRVVVKYT